MAHIFALSDIHGDIHALDKRLAELDAAFHIFAPATSDTLVVCGDLIDGEPHSAQVIERLRALQEHQASQPPQSPQATHPSLQAPHGLKIVVLKGNHEAAFLDFLNGDNNGWLADPLAKQTYYSFFPELDKAKFEALPEATQAELARADFITEKPDVIGWLTNLPLFYETKKQIFVHAGIDEAAEDLWRVGTGEYTFIFKGYVEYGPFIKDVVAGHINVRFVSGDQSFDGVYWDGASHFYLDGSGHGSLPILIYDEETERYSQLWDDGSVKDLN